MLIEKLIAEAEEHIQDAYDLPIALEDIAKFRKAKFLELVEQNVNLILPPLSPTKKQQLFLIRQKIQNIL